MCLLPFLQVWDSVPTCDPTNNATMCWSYVDNQFECCTQNCEVVGGVCAHP